MSENKEYTQNMFEASYATYEPIGRVVCLIDSFEKIQPCTPLLSNCIRRG